MGFIYKIYNDINDKVYIGKTSGTIEDRFKQHLKNAKSEIRKTYPLYNAMRKYGKEHFFIEVVEETNDLNLNEREIYWIKQFNSYNNGYNATLGGEGSVKTDYDLIADLYLQGKSGIEIAKQLNITKNTVYRGLKAKNIPRRKNTEASKISKSKKIGQYDKTTLELLRVYDSVADAAKQIGKPRGHISACANGSRNSAYGFIWKFIE